MNVYTLAVRDSVRRLVNAAEDDEQETRHRASAMISGGFEHKCTEQ